MKRILSAIICLIIVIGILPTTAHAYEYQIKTLNIRFIWTSSLSFS